MFVFYDLKTITTNPFRSVIYVTRSGELEKPEAFKSLKSLT
jgi:hypothetical protein